MNQFQSSDAAFRAAEAIISAAEAENRDLTRAEAATFDATIARYEQLRSVEGERAKHARTIAPSDGSEVRAIREAVLAARDGSTTVLTSSISPDLLGEKRSLTTSTSNRSQSFLDTVFVYERAMSPIMGYATVLGPTSGAPVVIPRLTADPSSGGTVTAEAAGITVADPTLSSVTLTPVAYKVITQVSAELDEDAAFGIVDIVAQSQARELADSYGAHLSLGTGVGQPYGVITRATVAGTAQGTAAGTGASSYVSWYDAVKLYSSLAPQYRQNGTWLVSDTMFESMMKWTDTSGRPLLATDFDVPVSFLGRPIAVDTNMAALGSASKSIAFGDLSKYVVSRVQPTRLEISRDAYFGSDLVGIKTVVRLDADLVDVQAVKVLVSASS